MRNLDLRSRNLDCRRPHSKLAVLLPAMGLVLAWLPVQPAQATYYNPPPYRASAGDYDKCAAGLLETGLDTEDAAAACAGALYPKALSSCVTIIDSETELTADDALSGCRRVRRPQELASCVVGITGISSEGTKSTDVLDYCRRSLLPVRFSNCVVGLAEQAAISTTEVMTTCVAATNRPRQVLPNFIPSGQPVPLQPLPGVDTTGVDTAPVPSTAPNPAPSPVPQTTAPATPRSVPALW